MRAGVASDYRGRADRARVLARRSTFMGVVFIALATSAGAPCTLTAQEPAAPLISQALEHENAGRFIDALRVWRAVMNAGAVMPGVVGLERVYTMLGDEQELLPIIDSLLPYHLNENGLRGAQLRTLLTLGRLAEADRVYRSWRDQRPRDVAPFRNYARILLFNNRAAAADSVLREATETLGSTRALLLEVAQMQAALGRWRESAEAWRETMRDQAYYESATVFSLTPAPPDAREAIREVLGATGAPVGARQSMASLELAWGAPRTAWLVLEELPLSDTTVAVWRTFAEEAERAQAWSAVRDAMVALHRARRDPAFAERGAHAALRADDPETAVMMARAARRPGDAFRPASVGTELEGLARLGRAEEAERALAAAAPMLGPQRARSYARTIAWAWVRAGEVAKARAALVDAPLDAEDAVAGWLALYEGDLGTARSALRHAEEVAPDAVPALALLSRTRAERSSWVGGAFLALARGDSAAAALGFERAAAELDDATSLLLTMAARVETARGADARALPLWTRIAIEHATAPEAPEARLEWSRALRRQGQVGAARAQLEHLIITYPTSALVPQARRELDTLPTDRAAGAGM